MLEKSWYTMNDMIILNCNDIITINCNFKDCNSKIVVISINGNEKVSYKLDKCDMAKRWYGGIIVSVKTSWL